MSDYDFFNKLAESVLHSLNFNPPNCKYLDFSDKEVKIHGRFDLESFRLILVAFEACEGFERLPKGERERIETLIKNKYRYNKSLDETKNHKNVIDWIEKITKYEAKK